MADKDYASKFQEIEEESLLRQAAILLQQRQEAFEKSVVDDDHVEGLTPEEADLIWIDIVAEYNKIHRKNSIRSGIRKGIKGASFVAATLSVVMVLMFTTVSAFRVPISNFFYEHFDKYSQVITEANGFSFSEKPKGWTSDYYPTMLPDRFTFYQILIVGENQVIQYKDSSDSGELLFFTVRPPDSSITFDTENRIERPTDINDIPATIFSRKDGSKVGISWHNDKYLFTIDGPASEDEIVQIAKSVKYP